MRIHTHQNKQNGDLPMLHTKFIQNLIDRKTKCSIYLVNGIKLTGVIEQHDDQSICLLLDRTSQLVYKHAVSTIVPQQN